MPCPSSATVSRTYRPGTTGSPSGAGISAQTTALSIVSRTSAPDSVALIRVSLGCQPLRRLARSHQVGHVVRNDRYSLGDPFLVQDRRDHVGEDPILRGIVACEVDRAARGSNAAALFCRPRRTSPRHRSLPARAAPRAPSVRPPGVARSDPGIEDWRPGRRDPDRWAGVCCSTRSSRSRSARATANADSRSRATRSSPFSAIAMSRAVCSPKKGVVTVERQAGVEPQD